MNKYLSILYVLILFTFCTAKAQQKPVNELLMRYGNKQYVVTDNPFYILAIKDNCSKKMIQQLRLKTPRQLSATVFIVDKTLLDNIDKEFIAAYMPASNYWKLSDAVTQIADSNAVYTFYLQWNINAPVADINDWKNVKASWDAKRKILSLHCNYHLIKELFLNNKNVVFIDVQTSLPHVELGVPGFDLSANKLLQVHKKYPLITGNGMHVNIKEEYYDTTDIDIRGRYLPSPLAAATTSNHANFMATIIAGAGNSMRYAKGAAWQAAVSSASFEQIMPEADAYYLNNNITIQNHSYGASVDNSYGINAAAFDKSTITNTALLHVFSSGNSGTATSQSGSYAGIAGFANLTGNFKMAKNVLVAGGVDSLGVLSPLSSAGPAYDGRIKPDIVAFQLNGTSEAAAIVSGAALLLQQYYQQLNGTMLPSALAKAILITGADDVYTTGPDYKTGFGNLNALRSMEILQQQQFFNGTAAQNSESVFAFTVPPGAKALKLTLAWNDTATAAGSSVALMNDLDVKLVQSNTAQSWSPWVLSTYPNADSLQLPARRGRDSINNVEQITVDMPAAGDYVVSVTGHDVLSVSQQFYVTYRIDSLETCNWINERYITAGTKQLLRWTNNANGSGDIEFSFDNAVWLPLAQNVSLADQHIYWTAPDTIAKLLFRMHAGSNWYYSDTSVLIKPVNPKAGLICGDSLLVYWNSVHNATGYQLYRLNEKYMEPFSIILDTAVMLHKNILADDFIAVAPLLNNGNAGERSYALNYTKQGTGCYVNSFYANRSGADALLHLELGTLFNASMVEFEADEGEGFRVFKTITSFSINTFDVLYPALKNGNTLFRVKLHLLNGNVVYSDVITVFYASPGNYIVYPVPVKRGNTINIICGITGDEIFLLYDASGRLMMKKPLFNNLEAVSTEKLLPGIYFYQVVSNNKRIKSGKVVLL